MDNGNTALALANDQRSMALSTDAMSVVDLVKRVDTVKEVQRQVMKEGHHYGKIPGVAKDSLFKPGAEILGMTFRLDPQFSVQERGDGEHREFLVTCTLYHAPTGVRCGSGLGSASTRESKYAWRKAERVCPKCQKPAIMRSKRDPEWYCWAKKEGCGATFKINDPAITDQQTGRVPNPDLPDIYNTVLKMAVKRAHVAAILFVTCASDIFTQDVEDIGGSSDYDDEPAPRRQDKPAPSADTVAYHDAAKAIGRAQNREQLEAVGATLKKLKITNPEKEQLRELFKMRREELENAVDDVIEDQREPGSDG